jgi:hypothetical protein
MTDFYDKLADVKLLRRAWHLARNDSRTDFMHDAFRYNDFACHLAERLEGIAEGIRRNSYHPHPLLKIDVPKSTLSVRPGSVLEIEDRIVLFAIAYQIAPLLDRYLPEGVYSWRVKKPPSKKELFDDNEILLFPFLKAQTIRRRIAIVEPWYRQWPKYIEDLVFAYEKEGFHYLVISDIVAYFENIDLNLLRGIILRHFPKQERVVNFLIELLCYWTWPCYQGSRIDRGIPQGNGVSGFLGNIYLMPLDEAFVHFKKRHEIRYLRYMDDVKILTKDRKTAIQALFLMNETLRQLRLNIQGAKTAILEGEEIRETFFDKRLDAVNDVIAKMQKKTKLTSEERGRIVESLKAQIRPIGRQSRVLKDKDLRLCRRLLTAFTLLRHSAAIRLTLNQLKVNPDSRFLNSAVRYLRVQNRNLHSIKREILKILASPDELFPFQEANLLMLLRYMRELPGQTWALVRKKVQVRRNKPHWYVRQEAVLLLAMKPLSTREVGCCHRMFKGEQDVEVRRAWVKCLVQLDSERFSGVVQELVFSPELKLQRTGRFCYLLLYNENWGKQQVQEIFREFREEWLVDRLYEIEILAKSRYESVRNLLLKNIKKTRRFIRLPLLKLRLQNVTQRLCSRKDGEYVGLPPTN